MYRLQHLNVPSQGQLVVEVARAVEGNVGGLVAKQTANLFKTQNLGLGAVKEEGRNKAGQGHNEHEVKLLTNVVEGGRGDLQVNNEGGKVGTDGPGHTLGADVDREDFGRVHTTRR
jgi:hypothetical protein